MRRTTIATLAVLLLCGVTAADEPAKGPTGTWKRAEGEGTSVLVITANSLRLTVDSPQFKIEYEADSGVAEGKAVFGRIRKVTEGDQRVTGDVFGFDYKLKGGHMVMSGWRGSGVIGLGALFLNGRYEEQRSK